MTAIILNLKPLVELTHEKFYELCMANRDVAMERSPEGSLILLPPIGGRDGIKEAELIAKVGSWNQQSKLGMVFSSSTVFQLPSGGDRSPDAAWISQARWDALTSDEQERFPPLCPDFVIELRSQSDRLRPLQAKMQEYLESGLQLGWLINPQDQAVEIYRADKEFEVLKTRTILSGEHVLPGFELDVQ